MLKLSEQLKVISGSSRIRIFRDKEVLFVGYKDMLQYHDDATAFLADDPEVVRFRAEIEVNHKEYKERGLIPPMEPQISRLYEFKDLTVFLYYDIYIE